MQIDIPLQPKQEELYNAVTDPKGPVIIGIGGSKGSSKSHGIRSVILSVLLQHPGTAALIFRRKMKQLRENMLESGYFKQWPFMRDWWREQSKTIVLPNGSRIVMGYAEHATDIDDFQGHEYMIVAPDEATRLSEMELVKLNELRRWTGRFGGEEIPDRLCKTIYGMNPGGPGHAYIRRIMYVAMKDKSKYLPKERPQDYKFIPAYAWDNVEWSRTALREMSLTENDYYSWSDKQRFDFFIKHTQRGHELDALPKRLRRGWLLGEWDEFAGQFFGEIWSEERFVRACKPTRDWHPIWLGIDWGFQHDLSCHWCTRDGAKTKVFREHVASQRSARSQAQEIVDKTPLEERKHIDAIYLSPDAFQKRSEQDSFASLMGDVFRQYNMPYPTPADDNRKHGAQLMYDLMAAYEIEIDPSCLKLLEVIPMVCTEEDDPEEIEKFSGDDAFDSARYALKSRSAAGKMPVGERIEVRLTAYAQERGVKSIDQLDINTIACLHRRAVALERKSRRRRSPYGRVWHPQPVGHA